MKFDLLSLFSLVIFAAEPEWNPAAIHQRDRSCLVSIMDGYMDAIFQHNPHAVPRLPADVRMAENTGATDVGEGLLWRSKVGRAQS